MTVIQAASLSEWHHEQTHERVVNGVNTMDGGHEVTRFLGFCPYWSWHELVEGMDGLSGTEGIHTPNSHGYTVGQA